MFAYKVYQELNFNTGSLNDEEITMEADEEMGLEANPTPTEVLHLRPFFISDVCSSFAISLGKVIHTVHAHGTTQAPELQHPSLKC